MAKPRNRQYNPGGGGVNLDLGAILSGIFGSNEIEQVPSTTREQGGLPEEETRQPVPAQFRPKKPFWDRVSGGEGQRLANEANIKSTLEEQTRQGGIRTKKEEIPVAAQEIKTLAPLRAGEAAGTATALNDPLAKRAKLFADISNDAELQRVLKINPEELKQAAAMHKVNLEGKVAEHEAMTPLEFKKQTDLHEALLRLGTDEETLRRIGMDKADLDKLIATNKANLDNEVARRQAIDPMDVAQAEKLSNIQTKAEGARHDLLSPKRVNEARQMGGIGVTTSKGIIPSTKNEQDYDTATHNFLISGAAEKAAEEQAKSRLGTAQAQRGYEIESATRPEDVNTAIRTSRFGNIQSQYDLENQLERQKQIKQIIPQAAEEHKEQRIKARSYELSPGQGVFDSASPEKPPYLKSPYPSFIEKGGLSSIPNAPMFGTRPEPDGTITPDPNDPNYMFITTGGVKKRYRKTQ